MKFNFNKHINESFDFNAVKAGNTNVLNDMSLYGILKSITFDNIDDNYTQIKQLSPKILEKFLSFDNAKVTEILSVLFKDYSIDTWEEDVEDVDEDIYQVYFKYNIYTFLDDVLRYSNLVPDFDMLIMVYALYLYQDDFTVSLTAKYSEGDSWMALPYEFEIDNFNIIYEKTVPQKYMCICTDNDILKYFLSTIEEIAPHTITAYNR